MNMFVNVLFIIPLFVNGRGYELKQVVALSRHNIRSPVYLGDYLALLTAKTWPSWYEDPGNLTPKGGRLERSMGRYFSDWLIQEKLLTNDCPEDQVFVYANNMQRTRETAKSFVEGAYGNCVEVYYKDNITGMDPVFNVLIRNDSEEFRETVEDEMYKKLNSIDLRNGFDELNRILDIKNSSYCKTEHICDLNELKNEVILEVNQPPIISGALQLGMLIVDSFLMADYDGMAAEDVAWGQIRTTKQWNSLMKILRTYSEISFKTKILDKDLASIMLKYLTNVFQNGKKKFYLLVGHDANINLLMSILKFKDYVLNNQLEKTPIGGKVVFQKWYDEKSDEDLLKVSYVYQSTKQIREGAEVSLESPPYWETLEMKNCVVDENGFCPWNDFIRILNKV